MTRIPHSADEVIAKLKALAKPENLKAKAHFGIQLANAWGLTMPDIRGVAKTITKDHDLAEALWLEGVHETRLIASMLDNPKWVTEDQMDRWVEGFETWDLCDQTCGDLFDRTPYCTAKVFEWAERDEEFVKRAAFAMIAYQSVHDKKCNDEDFLVYLPLIEKHSDDPRNFVKKAVNWALRQIGKRSAYLHPHAIELANKLAASGDNSANWIGKGAVRELDGVKVRTRLGLDKACQQQQIYVSYSQGGAGVSKASISGKAMPRKK